MFSILVFSFVTIRAYAAVDADCLSKDMKDCRGPCVLYTDLFSGDMKCVTVETFRELNTCSMRIMKIRESVPKDGGGSDPAPAPKPAPLPAPTPATPEEPRYGYVHWVRPPFTVWGITGCEDECNKDKKITGYCDSWQFDVNYKTCWLYKKPYSNPHSNYADFTPTERFEWAQANAAKPHYRTAVEHTQFLAVVLKAWYGMTVDQMTEGQGVVNPNLNGDEHQKLYVKEAMANRQRLLIERIMESSTEEEPVYDEKSMKQLIGNVFPKNLPMQSRLLTKLLNE